jgi:hypothetical protein
MRLTIDVSDEFHNDLKTYVGLCGQTMREFVVDAIESKLEQEKNQVFRDFMKKQNKENKE